MRSVTKFTDICCGLLFNIFCPMIQIYSFKHFRAKYFFYLVFLCSCLTLSLRHCACYHSSFWVKSFRFTVSVPKRLISFFCISTLILQQLIKKCWSQNVTLRPTFEQVKKMLDKMNPHKVSPVDMMMNLVML